MPRLVFPSVDVRDVAALHMAAMEIPAAGGQRVLASSGQLSMPDMATLLRKTFPEAARRVPRIVIPDWITRLYALFDKELRDNAEFIGMKTKVNAGRAAALLGRPLIQPDEAFLAMARTMIERDIVARTRD